MATNPQKTCFELKILCNMGPTNNNDMALKDHKNDRPLTILLKKPTHHHHHHLRECTTSITLL